MSSRKYRRSVSNYGYLKIFLTLQTKKFGFWENLVAWIEFLLNNKEWCVLKCGSTARCFRLERGAQESDQTPAYLFTLCLEILLLNIKSKLKVEGIEIFNYRYVCTIYVDDVIFFLKNKGSIFFPVETFE